MYPAQAHVLKTFGKLVELLPEVDKTKPQIAVLAGAVTPFRNDTDREITFRQESNFYYLTGCTVPFSHVLLITQPGTSLAQSPSIQLFIPPISQDDIMWSVPPPTLAVAVEIHETSAVKNTGDLPSALQEALKAYPTAIVHVLPNTPIEGVPLFPVLPKTVADLAITANTTVSESYLLPALHQARLTKDAYEIDEIRQANAISSRAHEVVMRVLGLGVRNLKEGKKVGGVQGRPLLPGEWLIEKEAEAEALFVASCRREGSVHQAYMPIVASSVRASTLHYCCNDKDFAWGPVGAQDHLNNGHLGHAHSEQNGTGHKEFVPQVLLIDAGCEWNCYASDITRTMPVGNGGKFTPEARAIYDLVLEMQEESFKEIKPDLHWDTIQLICHRTLVRGFQKLGIFYSPESPHSGSWNSEEAILASGVSSAFFPHGVGHSLGMDVHDVPSASKPVENNTIERGVQIGHESFNKYLRLRLPLEVGMVVTVEPGIYFSPHLLAAVRDSKHINHDVLKRYESVGGVRIEDVILITELGKGSQGRSYENLTTVQSSTAWVEKVCSGEL